MGYAPKYTTQLVRTGSAKYTSRKLSSSAVAKDVVREMFEPILGNSPVEQMWLISLDTKLKVIGIHFLTQGVVDGSLISVRDVVQHVHLVNATSIILVHNHPSGDLQPSPPDIKVTLMIVKAMAVLGIDVLDHFVCGTGDYGFDCSPISDDFGMLNSMQRARDEAKAFLGSDK